MPVVRYALRELLRAAATVAVTRTSVSTVVMSTFYHTAPGYSPRSSDHTQPEHADKYGRMRRPSPRRPRQLPLLPTEA